LVLARFALAPLWAEFPATFLALFMLAFTGGCWVAWRAETVFGGPDCATIVLDEILGMIAAMYRNPIGWDWLIAGFALFRVFDIIKPWPANRFDRMRGGAGVMLDDLAAGIYANLTLELLRRLI